MKFEKQKMVKWFSVPQLTASGIKVLLSTVFGNYADKGKLKLSQIRTNFMTIPKEMRSGSIIFPIPETDSIQPSPCPA